jgi:purine-binding chemotaxis protein CheW
VTDSIGILKKIERLRVELNSLKATVTQQLVRETTPQDTFSVFVFEILDERLALPVDCIEEVLPICKLSSIPEAPPWISGLLNLRGSMIPVVDVLARINRKKRSPKLSEFIVICSYDSSLYGVIVQRVLRVSEADGSRVQPVSSELPQAPYVVGVVQTDGRTTFLLSLSSLLNTAEIPEEVG